MNVAHPRVLPALALTLTLGAVPAAASSPLRLPPSPQVLFQRSQEALRTTQALDHVKALRSSLGLSSAESFRTAHVASAPSGVSVVRLDHTFNGCRVLGSQAIAKVTAAGGIETRTDYVSKGVQVAGNPELTPAQASAAVLRHLGAKATLAGAPAVEQVVFPARLLGGLATTWDAATGRQVLDRSRTVFARLSEPYVWAYEVRAALRGANGSSDLVYHVDARTGAILRIEDRMKHQVAPATGTGMGTYSGAVEIPTSLMADGTYALYDTTRGTLPNPYLSYFTPDESGWGATGMQAWYEEHDAAGVATGNAWLFQSNPVNTWGDGQPFTAWGQESGANGQSAGVDAMHGMAGAWDFFLNVMGRNGMDGQGTTVFAQVLETGSYNRDNASWSPWYNGLFLGAGSWPENPNGLSALSEFDVVAHEMTHGVTSSTVEFTNSPGYEEAGLDEATSDFFAQMAKAYAARAAEDDPTKVPATGADWRVGYQAGHGTPIRWMDRPSKDQRSPDGWYDGLLYLDGHYSSGPLNRALYFLAHGASATAGADDYSVYMPQGMTGIGNDKAAHIWFVTVTERLYSGNTGTVTYAEARKQAIEAAKNLYGFGWDCPESIAVENAFGAVNVGRAYGEAPRTQVLFADWRDNDWIVRNHFSDTGYGHKQYFPMGVAVQPKITVLNNANTSVTWSTGGPSVYNTGLTPGMLGYVTGGGVINADGAWVTPLEKGWYAITATSKADPRQFAEGRAFIINMDADGDNQQDAVDLGPIAFSWYLTQAVNPAHSMFNAPIVDDADVAAFVDAMRSTWWNK